RQRVGLAQALIADPPVLILDEPTSGLDPNEVGRLRELIARLGERKTLLLSTHVLSEVEEVCSRVLILSAGRLVADGSIEGIGQDGRAALRLTVGAELVRARAFAASLEGVELQASRAVGTGRATLELTGIEPEALAAAVATAGLPLFELAPRVESLEQVFRRATAGGGEARR
ncbi:MAG: AAA family ATPase, partial [Planctomycetota bacterium]